MAILLHAIERGALAAACSGNDMDRLAIALRGDEVVKGVDLGVEHVEKGLTTHAVLADGDGLARGHRFVEVNAVRTAVLLVIGGLAAALARWRPAYASGSELGGLTATRCVGSGRRRRADQKSDNKHDD